MGSTFTYYPTVDRKNDPALQILDSIPSDFITQKMHCRSRCSSCIVSCSKISLKRIEDLVLTGKASPKAVDAQNRSWIHAVLNLFGGLTIAYEDEAGTLVNGLIALGVSPNSYDICGSSPLGIISKYLDDRTLWAAQMLLEAQTDIAPVSLRNSFTTSDEYRSVALLEQSAKLAEGENPHIVSSGPFEALLRLILKAFECGPLTTAILADEALQVADLIGKYPDSMQEENLIKQTPLHVAVRKPQLLFLLLAATDFLTLNKRDSYGISAFDYTVWGTNRHGHSDLDNTACHPGCSCTRSLDMILETALRFPQILEPQREWQDDIGSENVYYKYAEYMRKCCGSLRQDTLQALVRVGIEPSTVKLTPLPGAYEANIIETIREPATDGSSLTERWRVCQLFYLQNEAPKSAETFCRHGFIQTHPVVDANSCNKSPQHTK
ncbi:hypothetical protein PG994_012636 [Apiospora phragmitis]|uniref:Uncharacterized protein n=1 Tax=Apiospora phragmitis TaxID=2905665 RepID=A0ABR1TB06_9PEZI